MKLFVSPHCDDAELFACFTLLREKPLVIVVFDGYVQAARRLAVTWDQRRRETRAACAILDVEVRFLGCRDDFPPDARSLNAMLASYYGDAIYAPASETDGHAQHNLVAEACMGLPVIENYMTYTTRGKSTSDRPVPILDGSWIALKHKALACYESQMSLDPRMGCAPHFLRDMTEYYA